MPREARLPIRSLLIVGLVAISPLLLAGCDAMNDLSDALYPTSSPQATALAGTTSVAEAPIAVETETPIPEPTWTPAPPTSTPAEAPAATPTTVVESASDVPEEGLLYVQNSSLYRGSFFGADAVELASVPQLGSWAYSRDRLAMARGQAVDVIDLATGQVHSFQVPMTAQVEYADVMWSASGNSLIYIAVIEDKTATEFERSIEIRAVNAETGGPIGRALVHDVPEVNILRYDDQAQVVVLVPRREERRLSQVSYYDLMSNKLVAAVDIAGETEAVLSPSGQYLITEQVNAEGSEARLVIYDLPAGSGATPRTYTHPEGMHSVSHVWSTDSRQVAFVLRAGGLYDEAPTGHGVWLLDMDTLVASQLIDETSASSSLVGWSPNDAYLVGRHDDQEGGSYYYAVRPTGGDRRIMTVDAGGKLLGWTSDSATKAPQIELDSWRMRFLDTSGNADALAETVAQYVNSSGSIDDEQLTSQIADYAAQAGWTPDVVGPSVSFVAGDVYIAQLPPFSIYVLQSGVAQKVAAGDIVLDARLDGDDLGLIFGSIGSSAVQPAFVLLRKTDGLWSTVWMPLGQRDWIATDGEIRFSGEGLNELTVSGSSFGLDSAANEVFVECHACPHRKLSGTWVRQDDAYVRKTELAEDADLADAFWEMTEPTPYGIVYEALRRVRLGSDSTELLADAELLGELRDLGLADPALRLACDAEMANGVRFGDVEGENLLIALTKDGQLLHVERVKESE